MPPEKEAFFLYIWITKKLLKYMSDQSTTFDLKDAITFLLKNFRFERYLYLTITLASIILLGILIYQLFQKQDYLNILAMLAPTGVISFSLIRILKMWTDCIEVLKIYISKNQ
ncbi:hypothetical protein E0W68_08680 [Flavobacterium salilacus subsp. salilacus]|uniref:hypothetical protein n=1 Tax=Flavobacterium TaxID=237 RepID=UPI0010754B27|nr:MULTISPECIES: hypothetical protein [Flavobacterium]KAF2518396.1 hypothetical protein E0W68_08680 [Flavobacterium salilacus subsp. salilacus]MBE1615030.1 hypothetical protein [Flavobacterium sp. SaA2.13]